MNDDAQSSVGIVFFALALADAVQPTGPNAALLLAIADELGLAEVACRAAVLRLRRDGRLVSTRVGRGARYAGSPAVVAAQRRWREHFTAPTVPWDGALAAILYEFPESERAARDRLRRAARLAGYGLLRPGLLVAAADRWPELAGEFERARAGGRVRLGELRLPALDARALARELWDLDRLADEYRALAAAARRALARPREPGRSPILALRDATLPIYRAVEDDPSLPAELLPEDWPGPELGRALAEALAALGPDAGRRAAELLAKLPG